MTDHRIPPDEWATIVSNVPIPSVDLLVRYDDGIIFGHRTNAPAKGYWFVPGGRIHKGETRQDAVHRVAATELGVEVTIVESLGAFEHFYDTAAADGVDSKHYVANGYVVDVVDGDFTPDAQHSEVRVFESPPDPLHEHVRAYFTAAETLPDWP